jgi:hypothetical protein
MRGAGDLINLAYDLAASDLDDETAVSRFRSALPAQPKKAAEYCLERLDRARETSSGDHAYRIASAAMSNRPVETVEPDRVELFKRIAELEDMPIERAYAQLATLVPALTTLTDAVEPVPEGQPEKALWQSRQKRRLDELVGWEASHPDPLVRTAAMQRLALDYLRVAGGEAALGDRKTPHREMRKADLKKLEEEGWSVEELTGGRRRMSTSGQLTAGWHKG